LALAENISVKWNVMGEHSPLAAALANACGIPVADVEQISLTGLVSDILKAPLLMKRLDDHSKKPAISTIPGLQAARGTSCHFLASNGIKTTGKKSGDESAIAANRPRLHFCLSRNLPDASRHANSHAKAAKYKSFHCRLPIRALK
jgi:hypothetical protein